MYCPSCGHVMKSGICINCEFATVCCICNKVLQENGDWVHIKHDNSKVSHGYCEKDYMKAMNEIRQITNLIKGGNDG